MEIHRGLEGRSEVRRDQGLSPTAPGRNVTKKVQNYYFNLNDVLGRGSFSTVYKGVEERTEEVVAVKVVELNKIESSILRELLYSEI